MVLDVDGVLISAHRPLPGSPELIQWLRAERLPFVLLTNDGCNSPGEKLRSLRDCGLGFARGELVSASHALADLVRERDWQGHLFYLMGNLGRPCYARAAGVRTTRNLARIDDWTLIAIG